MVMGEDDDREGRVNADDDDPNHNEHEFDDVNPPVCSTWDLSACR